MTQDAQMVRNSEGGAPGWRPVLDFWLRELEEDAWYKADPAVDEDIRRRFGDLPEAGRAGALDAWAETREGALALLIVLDQFPRNLHRGAAAAFACDAKAREVARLALERGFDTATPEPERQFFYMPFEHSEALEDQERCVALFAERMPQATDSLEHARAHRYTIRRFGRFPYRNAALGRETTAEEAAYLDQGGYRASLEAVKRGD